MKSLVHAALSGAMGLVAATAVVAQPADPPGQTVAYVARDARPGLIDERPRILGGVVGALIAIERGKEIAAQYDIRSPAPEVALDIAAAYASAHGYRLADTPIAIAADDKSAPADKAALASYIVDVDAPGMTIMYFPTNWTHFDLSYLQSVKIVDVASKKVVAQQHCLLKPRKTADSPTHDELLADNAAKLKLLIKAKSEECAAQLKTKLKLPAATPTQAAATASPASPEAGTPSPAPAAASPAAN